MGAQTSKVARKLPTKARPETLQSTPKESPATLKAQTEAAAEIKTDFIEQDSRDPHLHEHLKSIGPVTIAPTVTKMRTSDPMLGILRERKKADEKELERQDGTISIDAVFSLLEERKHLNPGEEDLSETRQRWAEKYNVDQSTLSTLLKYYNTMAITPVLADEKEGRRLGLWVKDRVDWEAKVRQVEERNAAIEKAKHEAIKDNKKQNADISEEEKKLRDLFDEEH